MPRSDTNIQRDRDHYGPARIVPPRLLEPARRRAGLRELTGARGRPLLCTALKPLGLSATQLAQLAHGFARAGIDLIKDDHSLADQATAPFRERVERCEEAVARANGETGGNALYFPNVTSSPPEIVERAGAARRAGCRGVVVNALPAGLGAVGAIGAATGLAIMSHPSVAGAFFHPG